MDLKLLKDLVGAFPAKVDLNPEVLETVDCGSYIREKVSYFVEPEERISAYLLIPKDMEKVKSIVFCHHQHASNFAIGKSEVVGLSGDPEQSYASELAKRGHIAFAPDAIAFGERNWSDKKDGSCEYFELASRLVQGKTLLTKVVHDITIGIDYLETRFQDLFQKSSFEVGFLGHSYGGRMAIWAPAFEKRIRASVSNCGCINYKDSLAKDAGIQMEFCIPDFVNHGDIEDLVCLIEPRSLLISATDKDVWSRGAKQIYDFAKPHFKHGNLELELYSGGHVFTPQMRERAYRFLEENMVRPGHPD